MFQHSVIETTGHPGLKGKAGIGVLRYSFQPDISVPVIHAF